jgi:hypothetical protein
MVEGQDQQDWSKAEERLRQIEERIRKTMGMPGVNMMFYAGLYAALRSRFDGGERSEALYREIVEFD